MRLIMTLLVRDESTIIRENIEYHLSQGIDFIIATDNLSKDCTPDILKEYEQKGLLHYIYEESDDYSQDLWVTRMAAIARDNYGADWVFHNDADEFWWPESRQNLRDILAGVPRETDGLEVSRTNFILTKSYSNALPFHTQLRCRYHDSVNALGKKLQPKICHRGLGNVRVHQGNHRISLPDRAPNIIPTDEIIIFHFPYRGYSEYRNKISVGGRAYSNNDRLPKKFGGVWRELYKKAVDGTLSDFYSNLALSTAEIDLMVEQQKVIYDPRLSKYMQVHNIG